MISTAWIEHHGTRIVSLAGFAGGLIAMVSGEFPGVASAIGPTEGALIAGASAALHIANRALDAFAQQAGVLNHTPESNIGPSKPTKAP